MLDVGDEVFTDRYLAARFEGAVGSVKRIPLYPFQGGAVRSYRECNQTVVIGDHQATHYSLCLAHDC